MGKKRRKLSDKDRGPTFVGFRPVVMELKSGDYIFVTGETDGWYQIYYRGDRMYVDSSVPMTDIDHSAEIAAELAGQQVTDAAWIDEYQMQVRAIKTARTWRILIIVLIVAFIAVTIISTLTKKKPDTAPQKQYSAKK